MMNGLHRGIDLRSSFVQLFVFGVLVGACCSISEAQHFRSTVTVNMTQLPQEKQKRVEGLQETVRDYIDNSQWSDQVLDYEIPFTLTMTLQDVSQTYEDRYQAQLQVSNSRDIQFTDKYCKFPYQMNDPLFRDDVNYDPLTGLIDFYVYMTIGAEMDKRAILGGTPYYQKAQNVCSDAGFEQDEFYKGWETRKQLVDGVLSENMDTYRKIQAIFFKAKVLHTQGDSNKARRYCRAVVQELEKMAETNKDDQRIKDFFKYHYFEIVEMFRDADDAAFFERLIKIDPDHQMEYQR